MRFEMMNATNLLEPFIRRFTIALKNPTLQMTNPPPPVLQATLLVQLLGQPVATCSLCLVPFETKVHFKKESKFVVFTQKSEERPQEPADVGVESTTVRIASICLDHLANRLSNSIMHRAVLIRSEIHTSP